MNVLSVVPSSEPHAEGSEKDSAGKKKVRPGRFAESLQSLRVYAALLNAGRALTVRELIEATGIADGTLYPILQKRVHAKFLVDNTRDGATAYYLTALGFQNAQEALQSLEVGTAAWARAGAQFSGRNPVAASMVD